MTWPWHLIFLSMPLKLIPYLKHAFHNILPEFKPSGSIILVPRAQSVKTPVLTFDLTLTWHVTSILSSLKSIGCVLWRAFECRLARLSTTNGSRDSRGAGRDKPPRHSRCASSPGRDGLCMRPVHIHSGGTCRGAWWHVLMTRAAALEGWRKCYSRDNFTTAGLIAFKFAVYFGSH